MGIMKKLLGKKRTRQLKNFGQKAAKVGGFAIKSAASIAEKVAPTVQKAAGIAAKVAMVAGQPEIAAAAGAVSKGAGFVAKHAGAAKQIGRGLEKVGRKEKGGFEDIKSGARGAGFEHTVKRAEGAAQAAGAVRKMFV